MASIGTPIVLNSTQRMLVVSVLIVLVVYVIYRFYFSGFYAGNFTVAGNAFVVDASNKMVGILTNNPTVALDVNGSVKISESLTIEEILQVPIDFEGTVQEGAVQFSTETNSLQVYKDSDGWVEVGGGKIPIAETVPDLVEGVDDPLNVTTFQASFSGGTVTVNSEATFNSATAAAVENTRIQFTSNITFSSTVTIPNKSLWIDLNSFTMTVPMAAGSAIICQQSAKNIYFSNGTIQYASGTAGSSSALISATNCFLVIRDTTLLHGEYAVLITGNSGNRLTFYTSGSTYTMVKARSSNNNTYGPIGLFGMVTDDSYIYLRGCTFDTLDGDTYLTVATDRYIMRGVVRCSNGTHLAGSCTITGCTINPGHNVQAVFYSDIFSNTGVRGSFRLRIDKNTIGDAGTREQLIILFGFKPLNCFNSIYIVENVFERTNSNKGIMYVDGVSGGSTDVFIFNNTIPTMKSIQPIVLESTYTREGNVVNVVTPSPHLFTPGYLITFGGSVGGLSNGAYIVQSVVSATEFTTLDAASGSATGTTTVVDNYASSLRRFISKDGIVRGPTSLTSAYLQNYTI